MRVGGVFWLIAASLALAGCNLEPEVSSSSATEAKYAPGSLRYTLNPARYVLGEPIDANVLLSAGRPDRVTIAPALPEGLALDETTGTITGTPTEESATSEYEIRATNGYGTSYSRLRITVGDPAPSLSLSATSLTGVVGSAISDLTASNSGGDIATCSTSPSLPSGLTISASSNACVISGTPTRTFDSATVTLIASSTVRSASVTFSLTINDVPPQFSFDSPVEFPRGVVPTTIAPSSTGGSITDCEANAPLPAGLTLRSDCALIGSPSVLSSPASYTLTGTNSGGSESVTISLSVVDELPAFYYEIPNASIEIVKGTAMPITSPTLTSGFIESCVASPSLPSGLQLSSNCVISGTATAIQSETTHTITASNSAGSTPYPLKITVKDVPPRFSFATAFLSMLNRSTANFPSIHVGGTSTACSSLPPLPPGLTLADDCSIGGTASQARATTTYAITSSNSGGSLTRSIQLVVNEIAPNISYTTSTVTATLGTPLTPLVAQNAGGAIASCSISPALPGNLVLGNDCTLSGTAIGLATSSDYTITATNVVGSSSQTLAIEVVDREPALQYPGAERILTKDEAIATWIPVSTGGAITECAISPALPAGLNFSTTDCSLSGTPNEVSSQQSYTVTATNTGGTGTTTITVTVNDVRPSIQFLPGSVVFTLNDSSLIVNSMNAGGPATTCTVSPALPSGLAVGVADGNCSISGTPSTLSARSGYTVTATNTGGSSASLLEIAVVDAPPQISFTPTGVTLTLGSEMTSWSADNAGGAATSCSVAPSLPAGLEISSTCIITGTPLDLQSERSYAVTATNTGGSSSVSVSITVNDAAPSSLAYLEETPTYTVGSLITQNTPSNSGGAITSYSVSPALPAGLIFNTSTGVISGTPSATQSPAVEHTITGTNSGGSTTATVTILVNAAAPTISYSGSPFAFTKDAAIATANPTVSNTSSVAVSPALPTGLSLNTSTGAITGTPTVISSATNYTVTATNSTGQTASTTVSITVNDVAPSSLAYSSGAPTYVVGTAITDNSPSNSGGAITSYSISPVLPAGLSFNTSTGVISGTPSATQSPAVVHTVTGTNTGGSTTASVTILVNAPAPTLSYSGSPFTFTKGTAVSGATVTATNASSFSVSGTLPNGLTFSTSTGAISGTPTVVQVATPYEVTATNSTGQTTSTTINITVNDAAPSSLVYLEETPTYTVGSLITQNTPSNSGGVVTSYSISPALPAGLTFNTSTGVISGTPSATQSPAVEHTVTGTNSGGSTTASVTILVNNPAPTIAYAGSPFTFTKDAAIATATPTVSNTGSVAVSPALPTGLSFNTSTGAITGTPTVISSATNYTVTATNSTGQTASTTVSITVNDVAPSISFASSTLVYTKDVAITDLNPTRTGGTITACASSPALPTGLSIDSDCTISGTPSVTRATASYTITASNTGGSSSQAIEISVNDALPSLTYTSAPFTFLRGQSIDIQIPENSGGTPTSCASSPLLPAGLILSSDCTITGTPQSVSTSNTYSILATNTGGTANTLVTLQVDEPLPVISYSPNSINLTRSLDSGTVSAVNTGGSISSCSASPSLPSGLSLASDCTITGTPTTLSAAASYTLTASNSYGSATTPLTIAVVDAAPSITYNGGPYLLTKDQTISPIAAVNTGGTITGCTASPSLPSGLLLSATCVLSGAPDTLSSQAAYTITATNSGGSASVVVSIAVISSTPDVPNVFLKWISLTALDGSWNGSANSESRVWSARIDGSSRTLSATLTLGWSDKDLVQPPRLAPNGSYWVAVSMRNLSGNPNDPDEACSNLWSVSPDGSSWTALTTNTTAGRDSLDPSISADSTTIAFASKQPTSGPQATNSFNIWTITSTGTNPTYRTDELIASRDSREPSFTPSGTTLVYSSRARIGNTASSSYNLWKVDLSSGTRSAFSSDTTAGYDRREPRFSSDGSLLVYVSNRPLSGGGSSTSSFNLWISSSTSLGETELTASTASGQDVSAPEFSSGDRYIAFEGYLPLSGSTPASSNIWVYDRTEQTFTSITENTASGLDSQLLPGSTW